MKHPKAIDPRSRALPHKLDPKKARKKELNAVSRSKREGGDAYAARILRDLEAKEEYYEDYE